MPIITAALSLAPVPAPAQERSVTEAVKAIETVEQALRSNPRDPKTLNMAWRVYLAANQWEKALTVGEELISVDSAMADTSFYIRNTAAATAISPTRGAEMVGLGLAKYPNNATLSVMQADILYKLGHSEQALKAINRALTSEPRVEGAYAQKAFIFSLMNQYDSVIATIRLGAASGADKQPLAQVALKVGSDLYKIGNTSKSREDLQYAVNLLLLSNELDASADAKFLAGASAFLIGRSAISESAEKKDCNLARVAQKSFATAQENVPAGLQAYADASLQLLKAIAQFSDTAEKQVRRFCK
jgi:tetratricopeptide (TPR) repeat protein